MACGHCGILLRVDSSDTHAAELRHDFDSCDEDPHAVLERGPGEARQRVEDEVVKTYGAVHEIMKAADPGSQAPQKLTVLAKVFALLRRDTHVRQAAARLNVARHVDYGIYRTSRLEQAWYIAVPCALFACCFVFQSFMLHIATHFYIVQMDEHPRTAREGGQLFDLVGNYVEDELVRAKGGHVDIPLKLLDATGAVPLLLCVLAYGVAGASSTFSIGLWNKTFLVASCMAVVKGVADVVTIMPDSTGWSTCRGRLGADGLEALRGMRFNHHLGRALYDLLVLELFGGEAADRIRYCADMMVSGHTYFAFLFSIASYKQVKWSLLSTDWVPEGSRRNLALCVLCVCVVCMGTELVLVALSRFHYTVDLLASIGLVALLFDSSCVEQLAADWSEGFKWRDPQHFQPRSAPLTALVSSLRCRAPGGTDTVAASKCPMLIDYRALRYGVSPWVCPLTAEEERRSRSPSKQLEPGEPAVRAPAAAAAAKASRHFFGPRLLSRHEYQTVPERE